MLQYTNQKYRVCRGQPVFYDNKMCQKLIPYASLKRSHLVHYYNELVIYLRIAENLVNTSISREIQESSRTKVEKTQRKVIELLHENVLPLIDIAVSNQLILYMTCSLFFLVECNR